MSDDLQESSDTFWPMRHASRWANRPAVRGSFWTVFTMATRQGLRLVGNLTLQRLLVPEIMGIMGIVNVFLQGMQMFTDIGIGPSIIQSNRGEDPRYLRTAWCVQIARGVLIAAGASLLAWPVASIYGEPGYIAYLPAAAFALVIAGFNTTNLFVLNRKLHMGKWALIDIGSNAVGVVAMIAWAFVWPSVWALIFSRWIAAAAKMFASHWLAGTPRMGFEIERESFVELITFGRWLFLGTLFTFLATSGDRLIVGKFLSMGAFGVYWQALMVVSVPVQIITALSTRILFPLYANTARRNVDHLRGQVRRVRLKLMAVSLPPIILLTIIGPEIIGVLFDERYQAAGWMIQILGVGAVFTAILLPVSSTLLAVGDSLGHMIFQITRTVATVGLVVAGGIAGQQGVTLFGYTYTPLTGLMAGYAISAVIFYPILAALVRRNNTWMPGIDALAIGGSLALLAAGQWLRTMF